MLTNASLINEAEMRAWLASNGGGAGGAPPRNSEEVARQRVGDALFEKIFRPYTKKQWQREPRELDAAVLARIPVHTDFDTRYFGDRWQALPVDGYTSVVDRMLKHPLITVALNCDYFEIDRELPVRPRATIYTGPVDRFFADSGHKSLEYRSLAFEHVLLRNQLYFQPKAVVNYPEAEYAFTRIIEHKHFLNQLSRHTLVTLEYPRDEGEPYYPVPDQANIALYEKYRAMAANRSDVYFLGRLAQYKYINMDQAIGLALDLVETVKV